MKPGDKRQDGPAGSDETGDSGLTVTAVPETGSDGARGEPAPERPPLVAQQTLGGRFTILRRIGDGGTGTVFAARDHLLGEDVALKVLYRAANDEASLRRLRDEVRAARRIAHPNVCRVHDLGEVDGRVFVIMELLPGTTLRDRLKRGVSVAEGLEILRQLAAGLGAAHRAGVVHCDVKPENALLAGEGRPRVVLTDFGIARLVGPVPGGQRELPVEGTPAYMAPEQILGEPVDERTDVYGLAVIACELLLRVHPHGVTSGLTFQALSKRVLSDEPRLPGDRPSEVEPGARAALARVLGRGLARDPFQRFDGVEALVAALVAAAGHVASARGEPAPAEGEPEAAAARHTPQPRRAATTGGKGVRRLCTIAHVHLAARPGRDPGDTKGDDDQDDERIGAMLDVAEAALGDAGGVVVARLPRAVVAAFGARSAQGDEPQRAADAVRAVIAAAGDDVRVTAAIDTGRLLVRSGPTGALTVAGDALGRAAALAEAPGGRGSEARATERAARHLVRRFQLEPAGAGSSRIVARRAAARAELRGVPLLGRERELARLVETLAGAARLGRPRGALLLGPPGVGKSRLLREVTSALASRGFVPLVAGATPDDALEPFAVLRVLLRELLGLSEQPGLEEAAAAARRALARAGSEGGALVAALAALVGPRAGDVSLGAGRTIGLPGAPVVGAARAALAAMAAARPLLIVVEDAGWADDATLDLLESMARGELEAPIAILAEGRADILERRPRAGDAYALRLELGPLPPARAEELAALCLGALATPEAARALAEAADGNPFHIEEMARDLVERGRSAPASLPSPTTVEEAIQARLDRLGGAARDVLRAAAVLGRTFRRAELADLLVAAGEAAAALEVDAQLDELEARRILMALPPDAVCDDRAVIKHALIREVAYRELAPATRRLLHAAAARLLRAGRLDTVEGGGEGERLAELARHLEGADERADAHATYRRAGELALAQGAPSEARRCLNRARALAGELVTPELLVSVATAALEAGASAESEEALDAALAGCEGDPGLSRVAARAHYVRSALAKQRGRWEESAAAARRGLALLEGVEEPVLAALLHGALGWVVGYMLGDVHAGLAECLLAVELLSGTPHLAELGVAYSSLGAAYMRAGRWRDQLRCNRKNLEIGEKLGSIELCARAHLNLGVNLQTLGDTEESMVHTRTSLSLRERMCSPPGIGLARNNLAIALIDAGRLDEAERELDEAARLSELCGGLYYAYEVATSRARLAARRGDLPRALAHAGEALELAHRDGSRIDQGIAHKFLGAIHSMTGRHDEATRELAEAAALLEGADLGEAARVLAEQARAAARRGDPAADGLLVEAGSRLGALRAALDEAHIRDLAWI